MRRYRLWRARRVWLRDPERALALLGAPDARGHDADSLGLLAWLTLTWRRDEAGAERAARAALERRGDTRFASAALAEVLLRRGRADEAVEVLRAQHARLPHVPWYVISIADALVEGGREDEAVAILERAAAQGPPLRRHALKRLSRLSLAAGDRERALRFYRELVGIGSDYLVYSSDYATLGRLELEAGDREAARATWRAGSETFPRNAALRGLLREHFGEEPPAGKPNIAPVAEGELGVRRLPVRTRFITARTGLVGPIREAIDGVAEPGDVVALAESAAAAGLGRITPLELVRPGALARLLSRFVGAIGPLHSPEGMEGAIMEAGRPRVLAGAVASAIGKLLGRRGWFYRVAGPRTAMIDDVAAALPPHDHHVVFGPGDADGLAARLSRELGHPVAVVDANHLTGAWVVGASDGVDRRWVERALNDNPAGQEDEQTPVVLVRRVESRVAAPAS